MWGVTLRFRQMNGFFFLHFPVVFRSVVPAIFSDKQPTGRKLQFNLSLFTRQLQIGIPRIPPSAYVRKYPPLGSSASSQHRTTCHHWTVNIKLENLPQTSLWNLHCELPQWASEGPHAHHVPLYSFWAFPTPVFSFWAFPTPVFSFWRAIARKDKTNVLCAYFCDQLPWSVGSLWPSVRNVWCWLILSPFLSVALCLFLHSRHVHSWTWKWKI